MASLSCLKKLSALQYLQMVSILRVPNYKTLQFPIYSIEWFAVCLFKGNEKANRVSKLGVCIGFYIIVNNIVYYDSSLCYVILKKWRSAIADHREGVV